MCVCVHVCVCVCACMCVCMCVGLILLDIVGAVMLTEAEISFYARGLCSHYVFTSGLDSISKNSSAQLT